MPKLPYTPADHSELIAKTLTQNGLDGVDKATRLSEFANRLLTVNQHMNLTAITDPKDVALKHFADSIALGRYLPATDLRLIDVGTGAGFPSIPLSIVYPSLRVIAMDSTAKRVNFIRECAVEMGISNLGGLVGRAEEIGQEKKFRETFDIATARAVANLSVLCEFCLPLVKVGGFFMAMKSGDVSEERLQASRAIDTLGGRLREIHTYSLHNDGETIERSLVVIEKVEQTHPMYPRVFAQISKKPL